MLAHFHDVEHKENYQELFQNLLVEKDIQTDKVTPNQYFMLHFNRSSDQKIAESALINMINNDIRKFYSTYASHLGGITSKKLIKKLIDPNDSISSPENCIYFLVDEYDSFSSEYLDPDDYNAWNTLCRNQLSLLKVLSLPSISQRMSRMNQNSVLYGLSRQDVFAALRLPDVCNSEDPHVFSTNNCFEYLQVNAGAAGKLINPCQPYNSEASERVLQVLTASPITISILEQASNNYSTSDVDFWRVPIPCKTLRNEFCLFNLVQTVCN
ncbi:11248_t:CDS:2 [Ambispora gerdemannii]|uniref:11248_t:CDS:1 n=1 Tax=Ambispora gerdemannii TaxID=144530 RepID=A0A9N8ZC38_9GLOM|nr:11248_t:CDS:2 [Ambispora gerdemannii]